MASWKSKSAEDIGTTPGKFDFNAVFKPSNEIESTILFMSIFGGPGDGKSHFCLSSKLPIVLLDTEVGTTALIKRLPEDVQKQIYRVNLLEYSGEVTAESSNSGEKVTSNILDAIYNILCGFIETNPFGDQRGTFIIDSMSDVYVWLQNWLLNRPDLKRFEKNNEMMPIEWARIERRWNDIILLLRKTGWNVVLSFKPRQKWVNGKPSEEQEAKWQSSALHNFDLHVEIKAVDKGVHEMTIKKTRFGDETYYAKLTNASFKSLCDYLEKESGVKLG